MHGTVTMLNLHDLVNLKIYMHEFLIINVSFQYTYIQCLMPMHAINLHCLLASPVFRVISVYIYEQNKAKCQHDFDFTCMDIFTVFGMSILFNPKVVE